LNVEEDHVDAHVSEEDPTTEEHEWRVEEGFEI
jgi:hypothetical protein